jgi:hypothetical protein
MPHGLSAVEVEGGGGVAGGGGGVVVGLPHTPFGKPQGLSGVDVGPIGIVVVNAGVVVNFDAGVVLNFLM